MRCGGFHQIDESPFGGAGGETEDPAKTSHRLFLQGHDAGSEEIAGFQGFHRRMRFDQDLLAAGHFLQRDPAVLGADAVELQWASDQSLQPASLRHFQQQPARSEQLVGEAERAAVALVGVRLEAPLGEQAAHRIGEEDGLIAAAACLELLFEVDSLLVVEADQELVLDRPLDLFAVPLQQPAARPLDRAPERVETYRKGGNMLLFHAGMLTPFLCKYHKRRNLATRMPSSRYRGT